MVSSFNYILKAGAKLNGLRSVEYNKFFRLMRGNTRPETRILNIKIFKKWKKESEMIKNMGIRIINKVEQCSSCKEVPVQTICSKYFVCLYCRIVFKIKSEK